MDLSPAICELLYQVESSKDDIEELAENYRLLQKEFRAKSSQHEALKRTHQQLDDETVALRGQFEQLMTIKDEDIARVNATNEALSEELERTRTLLEEAEKARSELAEKQVPVADDIAATRENNKQTREYHYKWKMAEQENAVLQTSITRLENQVSRYKESLNEAEEVEKELRTEKRKLLRELRDAQTKNEELETSNVHLQKRLDRLRSRNVVVTEQ